MDSVETVTVLFTDLVGSTGMASRIGPAAAEEIRLEQFGLLREAIGAVGGDEVKNLGDGLMVTFDSASAALGCAARMQRRSRGETGAPTSSSRSGSESASERRRGWKVTSSVRR